MKTIWNKIAAIMLVICIVGCSMPSGMKDTSQTSESIAVNGAQTSSINTAPYMAIAPSQVNPGNFPANQTPMFVSIGWDDNRFSGLDGTAGLGGMRWAIDYMAAKQNPGVLGTGVYDGTPARFTFFQTGIYGDMWQSESNAFVRKVWNEAYVAGHETGNHSWNHPNDTTRSMTADAWYQEMLKCQDTLTRPFDPNEPPFSPLPTNGVGVAAADIAGWRTPHLGYNNNTFTAIKQMGFEYDCSINEGYEYDQDGTNYYWPYSLENGSPGNVVTSQWDPPANDPLLGSHPGIYELPVYALIVPPDNKCAEYGVEPGLRARLKVYQDYLSLEDGKITGFDYNLWFLFQMSKAEVVATLKYSFDLRHQNNKVPFMLGAHTDYYSSKSPNPSGGRSTYIDRQQAIEEFIAYVMTKSDVRVVTFKQILEWCKNPKPLTPAVQYNVTATAGANGAVSPASTQVYEGGSVTFTATPAAGYVIDTAVLNNTTPVTFVNNQYELQNVQADTTLHVTFKTAPTYTVIVQSGPNGILDVEGTHQITHGGSLTVTATPDAGFIVGSATLGTQPVTFVNNVYVIENVQSNLTLDVTFTQVPMFTVIVQSGPFGILDVEGTHQVPQGGSLTVTATPDAGYRVDSADLSGTAVQFVNNVYTIENVQSDLTLSVTFAQDGLEAIYTITNDWGTGFGGQVTLTNKTSSSINAWEVVWTYTGDIRVTSLWNGNFTQVGKTVTVTNLSWNGALAPGQSVSFGFNGAYTGPNEEPPCTATAK